MMNSVIIAAPLLIAAIVMAVRFVGCGLDTSGIEGASYGGTVGETTGLVGFWPLGDPSNSTTAKDSVSGAPDGKYHGATPGVTGLVCDSAADASSTAASFDGVNGYVSVGFDQNLNPPHFTVEALVYPSTIATSAIVSSDTGYQLALNGNGSFQASVGSGGSFGTPVVVNAGAKNNNGPFYVAMTYDGTNLTLYVNPAASGGPSTLGSDMYQQGTPSYTPATSGPLLIGASASGGSPSDFFAGTIQDVAVYNRALGFYEIVNHFTTGLCGISPYPGGPTNSGDMAVTGNLGGSGTLSLVGSPAFPATPPATWAEQSGGSYTYDIPYWCTYMDVFLLGAGGGGAYGFSGNGGQAGSWYTVTLYRGSGAPQSGQVQIPATTPSINITVGSGGAAGTNTVAPGAGGSTTAIATGLSKRNAAGGMGGANVNPQGAAVNPPSETVNGTTETGGTAQGFGSGNGNPPGGGGAGGFALNGGTGADGAAWIVARQ